MQRRQALLVIALTAVGAGCVSDTEDTAETTPTATATPAETDAPEDIYVVLDNKTLRALSVTLDIDHDGEQFFAEETTVPADDRSSVLPGISQTGKYACTLSIGENRTESFEWTVEEYDLQMGSNVIVRLSEDDVRVVVEE